MLFLHLSMETKHWPFSIRNESSQEFLFWQANPNVDEDEEDRSIRLEANPISTSTEEHHALRLGLSGVEEQELDPQRCGQGAPCQAGRDWQPHPNENSSLHKLSRSKQDHRPQRRWRMVLRRHSSCPTSSSRRASTSKSLLPPAHLLQLASRSRSKKTISR